VRAGKSDYVLLSDDVVFTQEALETFLACGAFPESGLGT